MVLQEKALEKKITLNPKPSGHGTAEKGPQEKITLNPKPSRHGTAGRGPQKKALNPKPLSPKP